ncbi:MAG: FHA domain-containing protein [Pseudomonadales bacterium]|nr:FHA domain-containing protein [Pseudomonadales bacterium]
MARIELENGVSFAIDENSLPLRIGRDSNSDICLPFSHVSRHHCELYLLGGTLCIRDTSTNGTRVDNRTIREESVSLRRPTSVLLANETRLTISPCIVTEINEDDSPWRPERRENDRRTYERRQMARPVEVDRRVYNERRFAERRAISQF